MSPLDYKIAEEKAIHEKYLDGSLFLFGSALIGFDHLDKVRVTNEIYVPLKEIWVVMLEEIKYGRLAGYLFPEHRDIYLN